MDNVRINDLEADLRAARPQEVINLYVKTDRTIMDPTTGERKKVCVSPPESEFVCTNEWVDGQGNLVRVWEEPPEASHGVIRDIATTGD